MNQLKVASQLPQTEFRLVVLNGPERGAIYRLLSPQVTLGRGADCDIVLSYDSKCSRRHAQINFNGTQFEVHDISDRNKIYVNGHEVKNSLLTENTTLLLGETELRFESANSISVKDPTRVSIPLNFKKPKINPIQIVIVLVVLIFGYILMSSSAKKRAEVSIRNDEQIQADIATAEALKESASKKRLGSATGNPNEELAMDESQAIYIRGFRDYRKGQYGRALESFQACLSIYPQHVLCNRYKRLSERKYNELVQYQMVLGRRYRDQQQYSACVAAFQNVMYMILDTNNATFKEAKANYQACATFIGERY